MKIRTGSVLWEISFPLTAVMTCVILYDSSLSVVICFVSVLLHECGHMILMYCFGRKPERIRLTLFDIAIIDRGKYKLDFFRETAVTLGGVSANLAAALVCVPLFVQTGSQIAERLISTNLTLAFFNILPVYSLDGGQALSLLLCRYLDIRKALIICDIVSVIVLIPLCTFGFYVLIETGYNFSVLLTSVYLIIVLIRKS